MARRSTRMPAIPVVAAQPAAGCAAAEEAGTAGARRTRSLTALQYAAEGGHPIAQWKLGRMYADGDGVAQDDLRAFDYFSRIANAHAEDNPSAPQAADRRQRLRGARPLLSQRHSELEGQVRSGAGAGDVLLRRLLFRQCRRAIRSGPALPEERRTPRGTISAMARAGSVWPRRRASIRRRRLLGQMLFNGDQLPRQAARGLMWLTLARDSAGAGRDLDQGKLQPGVRQGVRRRPRHGAADARALGAGQAGLERGMRCIPPTISRGMQ